MKADIHPDYFVSEVTCGCGSTFVTRSTKPNIKLEICSACHPFYTGRQKFVDTAGRVEKFTRKYSWGRGAAEGDATAEAEAEAPKKAEAKPQEAAAPETFKSLAKKQKKALAAGAQKQLAERAARKKAEAGEAGEAAKAEGGETAE